MGMDNLRTNLRTNGFYLKCVIPQTVVITGMAGVAQLVERWIVIPVVEGSNPFARPRFTHLITLLCAGVAQLDRASDFGAEG